MSDPLTSHRTLTFSIYAFTFIGYQQLDNMPKYFPFLLVRNLSWNWRHRGFAVGKVTYYLVFQERSEAVPVQLRHSAGQAHLSIPDTVKWTSPRFCSWKKLFWSLLCCSWLTYFHRWATFGPFVTYGPRTNNKLWRACNLTWFSPCLTGPVD